MGRFIHEHFILKILFQAYPFTHNYFKPIQKALNNECIYYKCFGIITARICFNIIKVDKSLKKNLRNQERGSENTNERTLKATYSSIVFFFMNLNLVHLW